MKLKGRTILITGGSSGIGFELARQLLAAGNTVLITGRDAGRLRAAQAELPDVKTFLSDASDPSAIEALYREVTTGFPQLDVLVNNAGIMRNLKLDQAPAPDEVAREIDVDLSGPIQMVQEFLPHLKTRPSSLIVNVSSGLALIPFTIAPIYSAAKAGLHAYTRCLRVQLQESSVEVVELLPPGTETKLFRGEFEKELKGQKAMPVPELVKRAIAGIEAGKTEVRPGLAGVLGVMSRLAPHFMMKQLTRMSAPKQ